MSIKSFFHSFEGAVIHVFQWIHKEEPKVVAETEMVVLKIETYIGTNKTLSAIATPIEEALKAEAASFVAQAKGAVATGTPVTTMASTIANDLRAAGKDLLSKVETAVLPQVKAMAGSGTALQMGLNAAWATFGPQIEAFVLSLL